MEQKVTVDNITTLVIAYGAECHRVSSLSERAQEYLAAIREAVGRFESVETRIEWAAELRGYDGGVKHTPGGDEAHARMVAESTAYHLSTLNEPTRREGGVESAVLVRRDVRKLADGTLVISPWREVKEDRTVVMSLEEITTGPLDLAAVRAYVEDLGYGDGAAGAAVAERLLDELDLLLGPDAQERLARHLYRKYWDGDPPQRWEVLPAMSTEHWLAQADEMLAVAAGKEDG